MGEWHRMEHISVWHAMCDAAAGPWARMSTAACLHLGHLPYPFWGLSFSLCAIRLVITGLHLININCFCDPAELILLLPRIDGGHAALGVVRLSSGDPQSSVEVPQVPLVTWGRKRAQASPETAWPVSLRSFPILMLQESEGSGKWA